MRRKTLRILSLTIILAMVMTGCSKKEGLAAFSKDELIQAYTDLSTQYNTLYQEKADIEALYNSLNVDSKPEAAIGFVGDATGVYTFNSRDAKIIFPETFKYPGAQQVKANGSIFITDTVSVSPGPNWIIKNNGTTIELEHSNGISGIIKVGDASNVFEANILRDDVLVPWFDDNNIPSGSRTYMNIFSSAGSTPIGVDASTPIMIDSEDAFLRCGMCCSNGKAITYVFVYRSKQDVSKDESVISIIESIKSNGHTLSVDF